LRLIPLTHQLLQHYNNSRTELESALDLNHSEIKFDPHYKTEIEGALINFCLPKTLEFPDRYHWFTTWEIVLKSDNISVGGIGFNSDPNGKKAVEMGYVIYENHQAKGYAAEALHVLTQWALAQDEVEVIIVQTDSDNILSQKILDKNGFIRIKEVNNLLTYKLQKPLSIIHEAAPK